MNPPVHTGLRDAAITYTAHGWPILRGTTRDGELLPRPPVRATHSPRTAETWWHAEPHAAILTPAGSAFDVLAAPVWLGTAALATSAWRRHPCPVSRTPHGARFLLRPGSAPAASRHDKTAALPDDLAWIPGVRWTAPGELEPLPPTRDTSWLITPESVRWRLGDPRHTLTALHAAATTSTMDQPR